MAELTYDKFLTALVVILLLAGAYNTIMQAIKTRREEKRLKDSPVTKLTERVDRHDELLAKDKDRIDRLESDMVDTGMAIRVLLRQSMAVNAHLISGNDIERLKESNAEIQEYLTSRK